MKFLVSGSILSSCVSPMSMYSRGPLSCSASIPKYALLLPLGVNVCTVMSCSENTSHSGCIPDSHISSVPGIHLDHHQDKAFTGSETESFIGVLNT